MHNNPELLAGMTPSLGKHKTGASVFRFAGIDEGLLAELAALVARSFDAYIGGV